MDRQVQPTLKVAIVSAGSRDYAPLLEVTNPSKIAYAQKHGYAFFCFEFPKERGDAMKRDAYNELYGKCFDVMVWIDGDAAITNPDIRVEDIVEHYLCDGHFLWSWDYAGPNSGVYIVRFTPQGAHWIDRAYSTMLENGLADETAMEILQTTMPFKEWVRTCPGRVMNAYPAPLYGWDKFGIDYARTVNHWEPDCWILHLPGMENERRIAIFKEILA